MDTLYVDINVDLFEFKDEILANLSTKELTDEINERLKDESNIDIHKSIKSLNQYVSVDISEFEYEILPSLNDEEILSEIEDRELDFPLIKENMSRQDIASILGLQPWATDEQLFEEIKNLR